MNAHQLLMVVASSARTRSAWRQRVRHTVAALPDDCLTADLAQTAARASSFLTQATVERAHALAHQQMAPEERALCRQLFDAIASRWRANTRGPESFARASLASRWQEWPVAEMYLPEAFGDGEVRARRTLVLIR